MYIPGKQGSAREYGEGRGRVTVDWGGGREEGAPLTAGL